MLDSTHVLLLADQSATATLKHTDQIPMRPMQLDPREPALRHEPRRVHELAHDRLDLRDRHLPRRAEQQRPEGPREQPAANVQRDRAGRDRLGEEPPLARAQGRLPARVADLDDGGRAVLLAGVSVLAPEGEGLLVEVASSSSFSVFGGGGGGGCRGRQVEGASEIGDVHLDVACGFHLARQLPQWTGFYALGIESFPTCQEGTPAPFGPPAVCLEDVLIGDVVRGQSLGHCGLGDVSFERRCSI